MGSRKGERLTLERGEEKVKEEKKKKNNICLIHKVQGNIGWCVEWLREEYMIEGEEDERKGLEGLGDREKDLLWRQGRKEKRRRGK